MADEAGVSASGASVAAKEPRVTIICPCFNAERFIAETIESVQRQTLSEWELIVVDDGSCDRSVDVIERFAREDARVRLVRQLNAGVARARNRGIESGCNSEFALFLDADDRLDPEMLRRLVEYLDAHPEVGAAYTGWRYIDDDSDPVIPATPKLLPRMGPSRWWVRQIPDDEPNTPFASILCAAGLTPSLTLIRRSVYERTGGWDEAFGQPAEDTHLFLQLALLAPIHYVSAPLVHYRIHATQSTDDVVRLGRQWEKLLDRWSRYDHLPATEREVVAEAYRFRNGRYCAANAVRRLILETKKGRPAAGVRFVGGAARLIITSRMTAETKAVGVRLARAATVAWGWMRFGVEFRNPVVGIATEASCRRSRRSLDRMNLGAQCGRRLRGVFFRARRAAGRAQGRERGGRCGAEPGG